MNRRGPASGSVNVLFLLGKLALQMGASGSSVGSLASAEGFFGFAIVLLSGCG